MISLIDAAKKFDVTNDNHWTADGLPKVETMRLFAANPAITRDDINRQLPDFVRQTANQVTAELETVEQWSSDSSSETTSSLAPISLEGVFNSNTPDEELSELDQLQFQIAAAEEVFNRYKKTVIDANSKLAEAQAELDELRSRLPKYNPMTEIQNYIRSMNQVRADKIEKIKQLRAIGIDEHIASKLDPRDPIDKALQRKR